MKKRIFTVILILCWSFMFVEAVWADRVFLNSGACYDGEIISHDERELTIKLDIGQLTINNSDIKSVQIEKRPADETVKSGLSKDTLIIDGLRRKALQINTYRCKMRTEINDGSALSGTVFFKLPDKVRADGMVASNVQDIGRMEIKMVSDGNIFWLYYPQMNMVYRQPAEAKNSISPGMDEFSPALLLAKIKNLTYTFLGSEVLDYTDTVCFEVVFEDEIFDSDDSGPVKSKIWFREEDGFIMKNIAYDKSGKILYINTFSDIETNTEIDDSEFHFRAPEGAQVIDVSQPAEQGAIF